MGREWVERYRRKALSRVSDGDVVSRGVDEMLENEVVVVAVSSESRGRCMSTCEASRISFTCE